MKISLMQYGHVQTGDLPRVDSRSWFSWAGVYLFLALILGGGTDARLETDFLLQLLAIPFIWTLVWRFPQGLDRLTALAVGGAGLVVLFQLLPLFGPEGVRFPFTLDAGRTLNSALIMLVAVAFFHHVLLMEAHQRLLLAYWFLAGTGANLLLAALRFSSTGVRELFQPFSWPMKAGFFANENHLAMLLVVAVLMIIALARRGRWPLLSLPMVLLLLLFQFVVSSLAGIFMVFVAVVAGYAVVFLPGRKGWLVPLVLAALVATFLAWHPRLLEAHFWGEGLSRFAFMRNTARAIVDHLPFGSGLGSFTLVYPAYESVQVIMRKYVNHVHNDWLELLLEGGVPIMIVLLLGLAALVRRVFRAELDEMQRAALLGIGLIMAHSLVDYPLRTMALATVFAWLAALVMGDASRSMSVWVRQPYPGERRRRR